jgi:mannan endo-1,4-beta-mannosidase
MAHRLWRAGRLSLIFGTVLALSLATPGVAAFAAAPAPVINIVDKNATPETKSLFSYLDSSRGTSVMFGHQHDIDNGITFQGAADGTKSDVKAAVGDYPALFGFDTLILEGKEAPGKAGNTIDQNIAAFRADLQQAHRLGGVSTISAHMQNFETGNDFHDATGRTVGHILPGGDKNAVFNAYLDNIATLAKTTKDDVGTLIPLIFRPFHENTGSWFWWGAAHATAGEFKELFRYTVEYLRDTKGVTNLLFAFSPNGSFGGDSARYLGTYPGDNWVDIMGYDSYENSNTPDNSDAWISSTVTDLAMISKLADAHGKVAALTEFGRNGDRTIKESGNKSIHYYTDLIKGIKANPDAKRIAYMMTWSNWSLSEFYVPYPAYGGNPAHEMLPDFQAFHNDPNTAFAKDLPADVYTRAATSSAAQPDIRIVSPADGVRITTAETTVRAKATANTPSRVFFTVQGDATEHDLTLGADSYYSGTWSIGTANLTNRNASISVIAEHADGSRLNATSNVILGEAAILPNGVVDDFEGYGDDASLRAAYAYNNAAASDLSLATNTSQPGVTGKSGARFAYDFTARDYGGFGRSFTPAQDWSGFTEMDAWLTPDGSSQKLVLQFDAGGQTFEAYPSLASTTPEQLKVPFSQFVSKSAGLPPTAAQLKSVTQFYVYLNKVGSPPAGSIGLDNIRAAGTAAPTVPVDPAPPATTIVEDFESYANDSAVQAAWAGRDNEKDLTLSTAQKGSGKQSGKFAFDLGTITYAGIAKNISQDWSADDQVSLWVKPDDSRQQLVVQFKAGGVVYEGYHTLAGTDSATFTVPFAQVVPASYQKLDASLRPTKAQLASVSEVAIFVTKQDVGTSNTGVVFLDDIRAELASAATPPTEPSDPGGSGTGSGSGTNSIAGTVDSEGLASTGVESGWIAGTISGGLLLLLAGAGLVMRRRKRGTA